MLQKQENIFQLVSYWWTYSVCLVFYNRYNCDFKREIAFEMEVNPLPEAA